MKTLKKLNLKSLSSPRVLDNSQMKEIQGGGIPVYYECGADRGDCYGDCAYGTLKGFCTMEYNRCACFPSQYQ